MKVKELLDSCKINVGWTVNARQYRFNGKLILDRATRTYNVWVEPIIRDLIDLPDDEIKAEISEYFNHKIKRITIWDIGERDDMNDELKNKLKDMVSTYEKASGKKFNKADVSMIVPDPIMFILDDISKNI